MCVSFFNSSPIKLCNSFALPVSFFSFLHIVVVVVVVVGVVVVGVVVVVVAVVVVVVGSTQMVVVVDRFYFVAHNQVAKDGGLRHGPLLITTPIALQTTPRGAGVQPLPACQPSDSSHQVVC